MGVEQVVEELHIELIILHDEYGLGFRVHDLTLRRRRAPNSPDPE
jgi:hypothetical protein